MKIPNYLVGIGFALFIFTLPLLDLAEGLLRFRNGSICFAICIALFAVGWLGGGDAKIFPVVYLFIPSAWALSYLFGFAASLLIGMILMWAARRVIPPAKSNWVSLQQGAHFPMGISFALSGLFFAFLAAISLG